MARWFVNNLSLMVLALLMAAGFWAVSSLQEDPIVEENVILAVQTTGAERLESFVIDSALPNTVLARVRAPRSVIGKLQSVPQRISVDFVDLGPGNHQVRLLPKFDAEPLTVVAASPTTGTVRIERMAEARIPISITTSGTPGVGFRLASVRSDIEQVQIVAPQSVLSRVVSVQAVLPVEGVRASVDLTAQRLVAVDAAGKPVSDVKLTPETVSARISLEQLSNYRDLPVVVKWRGQPAEGYAVTDITVEPLIVTVFGSDASVQGIRAFVETLDVVLNNVQSDIDEKVGLNVPPGVSLVNDNRSVRVRMRIRPTVGSRTVRRKPTLIGLNAAFTSTVQPATIDIVLNGPLPRLNNLTEDDVRATVDVVDLEEGAYQLTPRVIAPDGVTASSVLPNSVQVELVRPKRR